MLDHAGHGGLGHVEIPGVSGRSAFGIFNIACRLREAARCRRAREARGRGARRDSAPPARVPTDEAVSIGIVVTELVTDAV
jgi:two-component sensor histidine kinase